MPKYFNNNTICLCVVLPFLLASCSYLKHSSAQLEYARIQSADPSQANAKHLLNSDTFFVFGKTVDEADRYAQVPVAIAAYSNKFKHNERVDTMFVPQSATHYGLSLPEGAYTLLVYADTNKDQMFHKSEIVGQRKIVLGSTRSAEKIVFHVDIKLTNPEVAEWANNLSMPERQQRQFLSHPASTIRSMDDPLFDEDISVLGKYDPAAFAGYARTMFYTLEEDVEYKIPVIFVHGFGGSARSFEPIVKRMDLDRFKPWFFYYPSGSDLDQLAYLFYCLFLSGDNVSLGNVPMIIVAHSMGGLVVREALNRYEGNTHENKVALLATIASPMGGHPAATLSEKFGLFSVPAWQDLNPRSRFIKQLYRKPLPESINHQLLYAYSNSSVVKFGENSDGTVPLHSQLRREAQHQSRGQFGFNSDHIGILQSKEMIAHLLDSFRGVKSRIPESQKKILVEGGYNAQLESDYVEF